MNSIDRKILEVLEVLKANSTIRFEQDFCDIVDVLRQTLYRIRKGLAHFTPEQMQNICKVYNINANWILSIEKNMYRNSKTSTNTRSLSNSMPTTPNN